MSIRHTDCVKNVLYLCQFAHLSWASLGFHGLRQQGVLLLSLSPPSWWNAGQASLALIVQIESHTTVRGKFLEQVGTTEALPGSELGAVNLGSTTTMQILSSLSKLYGIQYIALCVLSLMRSKPINSHERWRQNFSPQYQNENQADRW